MSVMLLEPRDAGVAVADLDTGFFDGETDTVRHGQQACTQTCTSGFTYVCDTSTSHTCTWGQTIACDS
ncbi:hypothetical protein [Actinomadura rubrisoli]|uniref:Uncharacterized protein n=1 Tax=Actinomadura rubrisoli TaxID=2530368 RepID=A0A4R5A1A9_9ACTN|nr:hypothetical protein [Actinomadura rubrisoli]TDD64700.1 hypothetical protein E1298_42105 [Actinomadura rubrisoli]